MDHREVGGEGLFEEPLGTPSATLVSYEFPLEAEKTEDEPKPSIQSSFERGLEQWLTKHQGISSQSPL